jgi:aldehyde oxidoreductase
VSCQLALERVAGRDVTTLEGVAEPERERFARAFAATGALQCGFCTPGIVMRTKALLDKDPELTREKAARHLGAHLCRCTGYTKILDAVDLLASGGVVPECGLGCAIGASGAKYEAEELCLGDRPYVDDLRVHGMLHAALTLAEHARA